MTEGAPPKSLKDQVRWQLWLLIAANFLLFFGFAKTDAILSAGFAGAMTGATNLLPVGIALVVTSVLNGQLTADVKARLVFLRWRYPLPGHRAFSLYGPGDPRIDMHRIYSSLGTKKPSTPAEENQAWYRMYKQVEHDSAVLHTHREFLLLRDYAAMAALFLVFGLVTFFLIDSWKAASLYLALLIVQFLVVRRAAANYGIRLVTTVLAIKAAARK